MRTPDWHVYEQDILGFCSLLNWHPSREAIEFLLSVQRGYQRVGLVGTPDAWPALGAACLWRACCFPDDLQLVMAGTTKSGRNWLKFLNKMSAASSPMVREHLLFSQENDSIYARLHDEPALVVLSPSQLVGQCRTGGRPTIMVVPDVDRVPTRWIDSLRVLVSGPKDQWLSVLPVAR